MNKRIKELAKNAEEILHIKTGQTWGIHPAIAKEFAQLIIDECCVYLLDMDEKTNGQHNFYKHAAMELKKHFGVEE